MPDQRPLPRNRLKTRTGCQRCKQRRIKCDETYPHCSQCTRRGFDCPGYKRPLKWSSKYEVASNSHSTRAISPSTTRLVENATDAFQIPSPSSLPRDCTMMNANCWDSSPDGSLLVETLTAMEGQDGPSPRNQNNFDPISSLLDMQIPGQFSDGHDNETGWLEWADFSLPLSIPQPLEDQGTGISRHYFVQVCRINSCFDSDKNCFRVELGNLMASSPLIYHCVLSMSAAHLAVLKSSMTAAARDYRAKALSYLQSDIASLRGPSQRRGPVVDKATEALLGSVLIGMTDGWHNPSYLGTTHLHEARVLFKRWLANPQNDQSHLNTPSLTPSSSRLRSFMTGIIVYWEAMASFLINQPLDATVYLDAFCHQSLSKIHPNPWTGICTPLFVYLARAGTLARQRLLFKQLSIMTSRGDAGNQLKADLLQSAKETETALLSYQVPSQDMVEDAADPLTTMADLQMLAKIYRFTGLLELYRNFPELLDTPEMHQVSSSEKIIALAVSTLTLISGIPQSSGVNCLLSIPLIVAGSTLQPMYQAPSQSSSNSSWDNLSAEILSISSQESVQLHWRDFAKTRLDAVRVYVGLASVSRGREILERVWARSDIQSAVGVSNSTDPPQFVQWTEVMVEEKLETILG
ncbi:hypothetical protein ASPVEDRAFT_88608 [Aspergillus versicolor CBS 583.65]|uniref:Zn(2)-C6 fungal-type domain-containing protein n=1 Tax=Aspergillus versicolor CBS 583.65 TaxID=1036611 RepID=A0A1L9Q0R1_ASPVE|nr:uncharacterized protein ASPVEDRAFT_88608 [Aspergillus versicolor CBS 583.65]OJJ07354.1 hypothetical protein ASPVEDRAFT_88608 [Aspergillus versicolor CBS 583.65]